MFLPHFQQRHGRGRGAARLPKQGRGREALSLAQERDRSETAASMVRRRRLRRPAARIHRSVVHKFDTIFRHASEDRVNEVHLKSLLNLTVTVVSSENGRTRKYYSNFDELNRAILAEFMAET